MDYTITINPENWETFLTLKPHTFGFRDTMKSRLRKVGVGDRLVVYLARELVWAGVFEVIREAYNSEELLYPGEAAFTWRLEVKPIVLPDEKNYVPIKTPDLWNQLDRLRGVNHTKSGWIYNAVLASSLCDLSKRDTDAVIKYLKEASSK